MMLDSPLDDPRWGEAVNSALYLHTRNPSHVEGGRMIYVHPFHELIITG